MRAVVTGAAGFLGSHLADRLLAAGHQVVGIDSFTDYYARYIKDQNLEVAYRHPGFRFRELDLVVDDLRDALAGAEVVFHMAGRPGVRAGGVSDFDTYLRDNVLATHRLLAALARSSIRRFVFAGSSAIYGEPGNLPTPETCVPRPRSSYAMTKLAAEHVVRLYWRNFELPAVCLRYFDVYGPRQRPDMAISRFMQALTRDGTVDVYGDGEQTRDFTYVDDAVEATVRAATADVNGMVLNVAGGNRATVNAVLATIQEIAKSGLHVRHLPASPEDPRHSFASINQARQLLQWEPRVTLRDGLVRQWSWMDKEQPAARGARAEVAAGV